MEMLNKQITVNNGWQLVKKSPPNKSHVYYTKEKIIPNVNESTFGDKEKRKVAKVPIFEHINDRQAYEVPT